jgi:colanic acid biosynthesis glycosyl transferase WcaI
MLSRPTHDTPARKLVFVNRYFAPDESATSRMLSDLAFRLAGHGVSVSVVTSQQLYENSRASLPPYEELERVHVYRVPTATQGRSRLGGRTLDYASFHAAAALKLLHLLGRGDVVVAKTDPPLISIAVSRVASWKGALLVNWLQDLFPEVASALAPNLMPSWLERMLVAARDRSLRRAAMNVVLSEGMRERLCSHGIDPEHIRIVPNWADTTSVTPRAAADSANRRKLGLSGQFVVGYSGNLGRAHEFDTLLGAARLLKSDPEIAFLMTGAGAKSRNLQNAVEAEGLLSFQFQDYQPPELLSDSLAAADVHLVSLLPALEGLIVPSKIYGILAAGRPALFIGDTAGDLAGMIRRHDCGVAVAVGDKKGLASELRALKDDPSRRERMGRNARQLALSRYASEHALANWLEFLGVIAPSVICDMQDTLQHANHT